MLSAGVGAAGDVQLDLLVEAGETLFHLADEPLGEALGFGDGELAELGAGAGDGPAPEGRDIDLKADAVERDDQPGGVCVGHVDDEDVLHDRGAQFTVAVLVGELGELQELVAGEPSAQDACADRRQAGLALRSDADVVAVDVVRDDVVSDGAWVELVTELLFERGEEGLGGPAEAHEEVLDARAGAVLAKLRLLAEDLTSLHGLPRRPDPAG